MLPIQRLISDCLVGRTGKVGIISGNTVQWMLAMQAGNYYSMVVGECLLAGPLCCDADDVGTSAAAAAAAGQIKHGGALENARMGCIRGACVN